METLLFMIALIFEIAFAAYCIVTKKNHHKVKNRVKIAGAIGFVILVLSPAIQWSLRWILLAILVVLLAGIGTVSLIRHKADIRPYKTSRIIRNSLGMIVVLTLAFAPALVFPQHKSPQVTGEYEIETSSYTFVDKNRFDEFANSGTNRFVNVQFWYPQATEGSFPLVVFSHGATEIKTSNTSTFKELASHGYVVCSIDHPYHSFYTASDNGAVTIINSDYLGLAEQH